MFASITAGPVIVQDSKEPFLAWDALRRMGNRRSVGALDVKTATYHELFPESLITNYTFADDGSVIAYTEDQTRKTDYDGGGNEGRLMARAITTGSAHTVLASTRGAQVVWAEDGKRYAFSRDGRVYVGTVADSATRQIAGPPAQPRGATPDSNATANGRGGRGGAAADRYSVTRFSPHGDALVLSNREGLWVYDLNTNAKDLIVAVNDSNPTSPRVALAAWSDDGSKLYFTSASRTKWERGVLRYDRATKQTRDLIRDGRTYANLRLSKDGATVLLTIMEGNRPADVYVADGELGNL
jgi:Tol biopolymer transport system component